MAFAFYELSGGADFVPRSETRRLAAEAEPAPTNTIRTASLVSTRPSTPRPAKSRTETLAQDAQAEIIAAPASASGLARTPGGVQLVAAPAPAVLLPRSETAMERPEVTLVSLEDNPALFARPLNPDRAPEANDDVTVTASLGSALSQPVAAAPDAAKAPQDDFLSPERDIRAVAGDRVNMRNGPGTNFSVTAQLTRDTRVEILTDPGDGWVRLRPINGGPVGWMAAYLLADVPR
ncbi:MAG: hypothetical protein CML68_00655 [Rhodobacteraceae bacterium]|nr:hypothetical protein [Paracoccaceae bacterium]